MKSARPTVAIDFRAYDHLSVASGQYRYSADLVAGIAAMIPEIDFVVLGTRPQPIPEMADVFADSHQWRYVSAPRVTGKGSLYREQAFYFRLLRKLKIDLLHSLSTFIPIYPQIPVVETVFDMMFELFPEYAHIPRTREYRLHKWAFQRFVTRAIAISQTTSTDLERLWHFPASRTDVVYLGAPGNEESQPPAIGDDFIVLSPYNLEPRKNLLSLLESVASMGRPFKLVLFGRAAVTHQRERELREHVNRLGIENRLVLTGCLDDPQLNGWYRRADIFIFPSLYEGFGLPLLEAMRAGTCVISHNDSAMAEILGDCGLQINMRNVPEIAQALGKCLSDECLRRDLGRKAAGRAKLFTRQRMAAETLTVYRKVLNLSQI
jgi:glycosyltransferase involved in cell wall biosynthesis